MVERTWMKKCCDLCPYAREGTLFLRPERAEEFAVMANNPYNDFPCHKTADYCEGDEALGREDGYVFGEQSFTCHGFKTLQMALNATEAEYRKEGFVPDGKGFECDAEMYEHHAENEERLERAKG